MTSNALMPGLRGPAYISICLLFCVALSARPAAHPLATTVVSIAREGNARLSITIAADADSLIAKLDALASAPLTTRQSQPPIDEVTAAISERWPVLLDHLELRFDGKLAAMAWRSASVTPDRRASIRLSVDVPASARTLTWRSTLIFGSYPVVVTPASGGDDIVQWLPGSGAGAPIDLTPVTTAPHTVVQSLALGFTHILPNGIDHILFVLGLYFLSTRARQVLLQVSAFTLAHSITLGLTLYGVISMPSRVVEPLIALSVAYVGIENLVTSDLKPWRVLIVFAFGLLHGMGFAGALHELHLAPSQYVATLVSFNVGVEAGQLAVIAIAAAVIAMATRSSIAWRRPLARFASAGIGACGLIWTLTRVMDAVAN
jgi:hydrogenase/urease accessory protein HupE